MAIHEYQVVGRHKPTETDPKPNLYRMRIFAPNEVVAKSRYWYFLSKYHKMKKTTGEILAVNEIHDRKPTLVKNYAIFVRYDSRSGTHNLYKEFRDTTRCGAVAQMYLDMAGRHRARTRSVQIIDVIEVPSSKCKRPNMAEFHDSKIRFPLPHRVPRATEARYKATFRAGRPNTSY
eukprot:CAMPEP_0114605764 /NCGR_PEP_ID=MMETSP0168-20121206/1220_1 /TAXON_ID=95228 ORGANISM="Vannella sp., Strain DIVA3 517/6/12" /NCGR_SAMPLE_ID=MMETSP0168 /ASSEMBLY_ACC=CAM_ASM_000044 /LENGTH=175 /DNA_ID=CAMNT_0001816619 /DNA_START=142 /DNA_END=669 /DNA_ORIENTATION=+